MVKQKIILLACWLGLLAAPSAHGENYERAYNDWRQRPLDVAINNRFGDAALARGYYDSALAAYDRALMMDEHNIHAQMQIVTVHMREKRYELAAMQIHNLEKEPLDLVQQRQVAQLKKSLLKQKRSLKYLVQTVSAWHKNIGIGAIYDSNIYGDIGSGTRVLPAYKLNYDGKKPQAKMAAVQSVHVDGDADFTSQFALNSALDLYNKNYFANDNSKDILNLRAQFTPRYFAGSWEWSSPVAVTAVFLAGKSYLNIYSAGFSASHPFGKSQLAAGYRYENYRYNDQNRDKNAGKHRLFGYYSFLLNKKTALFGKLDVGKNTENHNLRTDVNYQQVGALFGVHYQIQHQVFLKSSLEFAHYAYADLNKVFLNKRKDDFIGANVALNYRLTHRASVDADVNILSHRSNQFLYAYDKTTFGVQFNYRF